MPHDGDDGRVDEICLAMDRSCMYRPGPTDLGEHPISYILEFSRMPSKPPNEKLGARVWGGTGG